MRNRFDRHTGTWAPRHMDTSPEAIGAVPPVASAPPMPSRVKHPVVESRHSRWIRVMRTYLVDGGIYFELIGEFPTMTAALLCSSSELGNARVVDLSGKCLSQNHQPIEKR